MPAKTDVPQFINAMMAASREQLFFTGLYDPKQIIAPNPTPILK
jgi:hypothetical protein